jgi:mannose-6-phosphate isomerase-like protein (cupin superfamily)
MNIEQKNIHVGFRGQSYTNTPTPKVAEKKWGKEWIYKQSPYAVKVMELIPGGKCSAHMHFLKEESFVVIAGTLIIETTDLKTGAKTTYTLNPYDVITLEQQTPHMFYCPKEQLHATIFIEASTQDSPDDNYRFTQSSGPETE